MQSYRNYIYLKKINGFTLLELVAVVVVLGILSSISIPLISNFIDETKIDSAKSKLNSAAVKCLQDIRSGSNPSDPIDSNIISNKLLESDGYEIIDGQNTCLFLKIKPISDDDKILFDMGFSIDREGRLIKIATPKGSDVRSCESWAGENCKPDKELMELIAHNTAVQEAKIACNDTFYSWLNSTPPGDGKKIKWDDKDDSSCIQYPDGNPPEREGCRVNGCTLETWAFEGTIVNGEDGYKQALESKYGKICTEKLDEKLQEKYTGGPVSILECGSSKVMWFHEGIDVGSEEEMNKLKCSDAKSVYLEGSKKGDIESIVIPSCGEQINFFCLGEEMASEDQFIKCENDNIEVKCANAISTRLESGPDGEFTPNAGKPGVCSITQWICSGPEGGLYESREQYNRDSACANKDPECGSPPDDRCTTKAFRTSPAGKKKCRKWARCMGL